jgi:N-acetylglutamate synthase
MAIHMTSIRPMTMGDYDAIVELMKATPGISFRDADSRAATTRYLERNPGLSFVAESGGELVGCVMCGHDGRRGYLQHLLVVPGHRRRGIASLLVGSCLTQLEQLGIVKSHVDVFRSNELAQAFWKGQGWKLRTDTHRYSHIRNGNENA